VLCVCDGFERTRSTGKWWGGELFASENRPSPQAENWTLPVIQPPRSVVAVTAEPPRPPSKENPMRTLFLNMTMSLDGYVAGPNGQLDWMTTKPDPELTADIVAQLRRADEGFIGYPTAEPMIRYWAAVAGSHETSQGSRDIANAVAALHTFAVSTRPEQIGVPNAEVLLAPDDASLITAV
jgi:hypothetical protein